MDLFLNQQLCHNGTGRFQLQAMWYFLTDDGFGLMHESGKGTSMERSHQPGEEKHEAQTPEFFTNPWMGSAQMGSALLILSFCKVFHTHQEENVWTKNSSPLEDVWFQEKHAAKVSYPTGVLLLDWWAFLIMPHTSDSLNSPMWITPWIWNGYDH